MAENVDNLILAQLRATREEMSMNFSRVEDRLGDVEAKVDGTSANLVALGKYIHDIDERGEHIERKLEVE